MIPSLPSDSSKKNQPAHCSHSESEAGQLFLHYELPTNRIAQEPIEPRDASRLLVVPRDDSPLEDCFFSDLPGQLRAGDLVVMNTSQVLPARLRGLRAATGGKWEALFVREHPGGVWECLAKTKGKPGLGEWLVTECGQLRLQLTGIDPKGRWLVTPQVPEPAPVWLKRVGTMPLPPYIRKGVAGPDDAMRYQTLFAKAPGSIAAPTAGLHFTEKVLQNLVAQGIALATVTLHVGPGTFQPLPLENPLMHQVEPEWGEVPAATGEAIAACRRRGGRVVAVGTTSVRVLESAAATGCLHGWEGWASVTLGPGKTLACVDGMVTNFHQSGTSLLLLLHALVPPGRLRAAYRHALMAAPYRFLSYGDAMLIRPPGR